MPTTPVLQIIAGEKLDVPFDVYEAGARKPITGLYDHFEATMKDQLGGAVLLQKNTTTAPADQGTLGQTLSLAANGAGSWRFITFSSARNSMRGHS